MPRKITQPDIIPDERWLPVVGYEGYYEVSDFGRVRRLDRYTTDCGKGGASRTRFIRGGLVSPNLNENGYRHLQLYRDGHKTRVKLHRIIAQAWIPNPDNLPQVNHKDENPNNNHISNLEWCTAKYNSNYGTRKQRLSKILQNSLVRGKPVALIDNKGNIIRTFISASEASRELNIDSSYVAKICRGQNKGTQYKFKYI